MVAEHLDLGDQRRGALADVPLEELLVAVDAVRRADDRARAPLDVRHHPGADVLQVAGEVELGDRRPVAAVGPERLVRIGQGDAHDDRGIGFLHGRRLRRSGRLRKRDLAGRRGRFGHDLVRGLVLAQRLEGALADHAGGGEARELDLGDQLRLRPVDIGLLARRARAGEGALVGFERGQARQDAGDLVAAEARADPADIDQLAALVDAHQQGAELARLARPAADHHLVAGAALGLQPALAAARAGGGVEPLRHDPFERHAAGRLQDRIAGDLEVVDVADPLGRLRRGVEQGLQPRLALAERQVAEVRALGEQQVEGEEDQVAGLAVGERRLQGREVRRAVVVQRAGLAVDQAVRQGLGVAGDLPELRRPVEAGAGLQRRMAVLDAQLQAIAVELDLVAPAGPLRRTVHRLGELRRHEPRKGRGLELRGGCGAQGRRGGRPVVVLRLVRSPDALRPGPRLAGHEPRRPPALAGGDLLHGPAGRHRGGLALHQRVAVALHRPAVVVLDQQPVVPLLPLAALHPHQHEAALQPLAVQDDLQVALLQALVRVGPRFGLPVAAVPQHHRAAAVLALRDRPFEVAVVERVVLHLDGEPAVMRVHRRAPGHRPGLEGPVELQAEVVVKARGVVLLDHEAAPVGRLDLLSAAGLSCLGEVAHRLVAGEFGRHRTPPRNTLSCQSRRGIEGSAFRQSARLRLADDPVCGGRPPKLRRVP